MDTPAPSRRDTLTLAGLGVVAVGEDGLRAVAGPARAVWGSPLLWPARRVAAPALGALVARGRAERVRIEVLAHDGVNEAVAELLRTGLIEEIADRVAAQLADPLVGRALASPELDRVVDRVLASAQLQRVVAHVAESAEVRAALAAQSAGLANEVAGEVRSRAAKGDERAERLAKRLLHRRAIPTPDPAPEPEPG
jgi:hypothetical protein